SPSADDSRVSAADNTNIDPCNTSHSSASVPNTIYRRNRRNTRIFPRSTTCAPHGGSHRSTHLAFPVHRPEPSAALAHHSGRSRLLDELGGPSGLKATPPR